MKRILHPFVAAAALAWAGQFLSGIACAEQRAGVAAQAACSPPLTADAAVDEALHANRDLRTAWFVIEQARARLLQAGLWPNPALDLSGAHDFAFANEGEYASSFGFEQRFPVAGRIGRAEDLARTDVALALAEVREASRLLIAEVLSAFYDLLVINAQIAERDRLITTAGRLVAVSEARAKFAEVSELDVNTSRIESQRLELERSLLRARQKTRSVELDRLLGRAPELPVAVTGELVAPLAPEPLVVLRNEGLQRRPDLHEALLKTDRARAERELARADRWEDWTLGFSYDRDLQVVDGAPKQSTDQLLGLRLTIPLPLFQRNQGRIAEAESLAAQAKSRVGALELTVGAEIEAAYRRAEEIKKALDGYRVQVIPLADKNVALAHEAYRSGLTSMVQVVQAQRQQSELRTGYLDVVAQYRQAIIDLEQASATSPFLDKSKEEK